MLERLVVDEGGDPRGLSALAWIGREFPTVNVTVAATTRVDLSLDASAWRDDAFDFWAFDRKLDLFANIPFTLGILGSGPETWEVAMEVLTRAQRLVGRRNRHSEGEWFDGLLARHRSLHDLRKPLVRADYDHALDVWQWTLRRDPEASLAVQLAAIFHDIERLVSEADGRIEDLAADYQAFKDAHARKGSVLVSEYLRELDIDESCRERVANLIASHERSADDQDRKLLADADALSFFSLNSPGFIDYYGKGHSLKKVLYTLKRLSPEAFELLLHLRLRADVAELVASARAEIGL